MSRENVELVRRSFEAHNAGGIEAALPFYSHTLVWDAGPDWVEDRIYRGHDGARQLDAIFTEGFEGYAVELHEIRAVGERVLALFEATGRVKGSGAPIRQPVGIVLADFREGKIGEVRSFFSWEQAAEAVESAESV